MNSHTERILRMIPESRQLAETMPIDIAYEQFVETQTGTGLSLMTSSISQVPERDMPAAMICSYHVMKYIANGCRDYLVLPKLSAMLERTSIKTEPDFIKSPYYEIAIEPPQGFGEVYNDITGMHQIEVIYVSYNENKDTKEKMLRMMIVGKPNKRSENEYDDAFFFFKCPIFQDKTVEESFEDAWSKMTSPEDNAGDHNIQQSKRIFHYCINVLLYITCENADSKQKNVFPVELENRLKNLQDENRKKKLIGMNQGKIKKKIVLGDNLEKDEGSFYNTVIERGGWTLTTRFVVEGHYHGYWMGSGDQKKLVKKWLAPYWKGPTAADIVHQGILKGKENEQNETVSA